MIKIPNIKIPNIKIPSIKMPSIKMPRIKTPSLKMQEFIMPVIACSVSLAVSAAVFSLKELEKHARIAIERRLEEERSVKLQENTRISAKEKESAEAQKEMDITREGLRSLETRLSDQQQQRTTIKQKMETLENKLVSAEERGEALNTSIEVLKKSISMVVKSRGELSGELELAQQARDRIKRRLMEYLEKEMKKVPQVKDDYAKEPSESIELKTSTNFTEPVLIGEVLTVNREFGFVVISLGKDDGMRTGMILDVVRDSNTLAQVEIETVRANIAAAVLKGKGKISQVRSGDMVFLY